MSKARSAGRSRTGGPPPERVFGYFLHEQKVPEKRVEADSEGAWSGARPSAGPQSGPETRPSRSESARASWPLCSVIRKRGGTGLQRGAPLSRGRPPAACFLSRKRKQAKSAHRGCGPYVPQGSNLRDGFVTLPARRVRDAGAPYWAAARGRGTEKGWGPRTAPGGRVCAPCGRSASGGGATYEAEP